MALGVSGDGAGEAPRHCTLTGALQVVSFRALRSEGEFGIEGGFPGSKVET